MVTDTTALAELYVDDETAWLEIMADLVYHQRIDELDLTNLAEYLARHGRRDRQEVKSRLAVLLSHLLKWRSQPECRSGSCRQPSWSNVRS